MENIPTPGPILLFGSGETLPSSGKAYEHLARRYADPLNISILETPAGFQPNSEIVSRKVGDFLLKRLQNHRPRVEIIPARHKRSPFSTDDAKLLAPMLKADWIFMGPGSPSYAIQHLKDSLAYRYLRALHLRGSAVCLASAAVLAISAHTLPVYEIYKVGMDPHWIKGLNYLANFGLMLSFIPHWNNRDGGSELDTSRCFMGIERFDRMLAMLPDDTTIVGIDEQTALLLDFQEPSVCKVFGKGMVRLLRGQRQEEFSSGDSFDIQVLGNYHLPENHPVEFKEVREFIKQASQQSDMPPSGKVLELAKLREIARQKDRWEEADLLREQIAAEGWQVVDTPEGSELKKIS